jgi:hypothetical protein
MSKNNLAEVMELPRTHDKESISANDDILPKILSNKKFEIGEKTYKLVGANWDLLNIKESTDEDLIFHDGWRVSLKDFTCYYEGIYSPMYELKFREVSPNFPEYLL